MMKSLIIVATCAVAALSIGHEGRDSGERYGSAQRSGYDTYGRGSNRDQFAAQVAQIIEFQKKNIPLLIETKGATELTLKIENSDRPGAYINLDMGLTVTERQHNGVPVGLIYVDDAKGDITLELTDQDTLGIHAINGQVNVQGSQLKLHALDLSVANNVKIAFNCDVTTSILKIGAENPRGPPMLIFGKLAVTKYVQIDINNFGREDPDSQAVVIQELDVTRLHKRTQLKNVAGNINIIQLFVPSSEDFEELQQLSRHVSYATETHRTFQGRNRDPEFYDQEFITIQLPVKAADALYEAIGRARQQQRATSAGSQHVRWGNK